MTYSVEVEFRKLREFRLSNIAISCSTININDDTLDFCSTEVYDHEDTINILMKELDYEGMSKEVIDRLGNILRNPSESDKITPYISWMTFNGEDLSDEGINELLEFVEVTYIPIVD